MAATLRFKILPLKENVTAVIFAKVHTDRQCRFARDCHFLSI